MLDAKYYSSITEYDEARELMEVFLEGFEVGFLKGYEEASSKRYRGSRKYIMILGLAAYVERGDITLAQAAEEAGMTIPAFEAVTGLSA